MVAYLEHSLTVNIGKLVAEDSELEETNLELLQTFVQNAVLNEPIPQEIRSILAGRCRNDYQMAFLPFLAFLAIEHSDQFASVIRLADALDLWQSRIVHWIIVLQLDKTGLTGISLR